MTTDTTQAKVSEYKIGNTTYTVTSTFSPEFKQSLSDIIQRMIIRDSEKMLGDDKQTKSKLIAWNLLL